MNAKGQPASGLLDLDRELLRRMPLAMPQEEVDKNSRGRVLLIGGSHRVPGAVLLSAVAALRAGAGKVQLAVPDSLALSLGIALPEAGVCGLGEDSEGEVRVADEAALIELAQEAHAILLGPGILSARAAASLTRLLLAKVTGPFFVIDAMALLGLWENPELIRRHGGRVALTPHAGEMASLCHRSREEIECDPGTMAEESARHFHCITVLKGATTFIASPLEGAFRHSGGVVGLATAGSGDVLAGVVTGLAARGTELLNAALWGVYVHGEAGLRLSRAQSPLGFLAREISLEVPAILAQLSPNMASEH